MIDTTGESEMILPIEIKGESTEALLDTGSPYTIMDWTLYKQLKLKMCSSQRVSSKGFAGQLKYAKGEAEVNVLLQNYTYKLRCQIVPNGLMSYRMVLGRNLLSQADVTIVNGESETITDGMHN